MHAALEQCAASWFTKAVRSYVERHQGCPWCGAAHCVFRNRRPEREQYTCSHCDFFVCHALLSDVYLVAPGRTPPPDGD